MTEIELKKLVERGETLTVESKRAVLRRDLTLAVALTLASLVAPAAQSLREISFMTATPASAAPVLDGALDDACWRKGVANTAYYTFIRQSETPRRVTEPRTECTVLYDDRALYIGVRNFERDTSCLRQHRVKDHDTELWTDDCAELYFDPAAHGESFYRFVVNSLGKCDHLWRMDAANVHNEWIAVGAKAAAQVFKDRWEFELAIPWSALRDVKPPVPGTVWTFDHNRYRYPGGEFDGVVDATRGMVSSPGASFTTPNMFGYLYFSDGGRPPAERILSIVKAKVNSAWVLEIDGRTYLHDANGLETFARPAAEIVAERAAADAAAERRYTEFADRLTRDEAGAFAPLPLPLAGTFDDKGPTAYDGFDGFYRQNVSTNYATPHFEWKDAVGDDCPRILFLTDYGATMRDAVELAQRFPMKIDVYPGDFGDTGVYVDAVSRSGFLDKERQFETYLAKNPDLIVLVGMNKKRIPARYRYEILRRIKREKVGFVDLPSERALAAPALSPDWRADYERRAVRLWNRFRTARGLAPQPELESAVERRIRDELKPAFGDLEIVAANNAIVPEDGELAVTVRSRRGFGTSERVEFELFTSPYGESCRRESRRVAASTSAVAFAVTNRAFATLAAVCEARRFGADGRLLARAKRFLFFPNHRWKDYTLVSWEGPDVAYLRRGAPGTLAPLYAPQLVERMGYHDALLGEGKCSAVFNAHPIPYACRVRFDPGPSNETFWSTTAGLARHASRADAARLKAMGKEINPYDPEVRRILGAAFENIVTNTLGYGVSAWSLGDECNFSIEAGCGPKDKAPFAAFLAGKYGTINRYNALRGTSYRSFAEVPNTTVGESAKKGDAAAWWDHVEYMEKMYHDTMLFFAEIVHRHDPKARVGAEGSVPGDLELQVQGLKFWGPYRDLVNDELLRVIAPDYLRGIWWGGYFRCLRDGFPVQQWEYLLTGTLNADLWFDMYPGSVMGAFAGDFTFAPYVAKMMPHLVPLRRGLAQLLVRTPFRRDGFALYHSHPSARLSEMSDEFSAPGPILAKMIRYCYRTGLAVDFVSPNRLASLAGQKIVFLPSVTVLSDREAEALRAFAAKGGVLVADGEPGRLDEWMRHRESPPLKGLWRRFDPSVRDSEMSAALASVGIVPRERITGLPPEETVFRIRELDGMRLVGFKTESRCLGADVAIDLGEKGFVYEADRGFVGETDRLRLAKIDVPFRLFSVFPEKQKAPDFSVPATVRAGGRIAVSTVDLRRGGVYRLSLVTPDGRLLEHRDDIFVADGRAREVRLALNDPSGAWKLTLRDLATGLEGERTFDIIRSK